MTITKQIKNQIESDIISDSGIIQKKDKLSTIVIISCSVISLVLIILGCALFISL